MEEEHSDKEAQLLGSADKDNLEEAELENVLESVPPEHRKVIERMMISSSVQMRSISSPETAVMKKITPAHISKYLEGAELEMKNSYTERFHKNIYIFNDVYCNGIFHYFSYLVKRHS